MSRTVATTGSSVAAHASKATCLPRIGFLGVGWIGRHRLEAIAACGYAEVAAIADPVPAAAQEAGKLAPHAALLGDLDELLEADLDGIVIATPSALHAEQAMAALQRGVAVFCQKPLARNNHEARQVVEAAEKADRLLAVDLSYRYVAGVEEMRRLIQSGQLGQVYAADLVFHNAYGPDKAWFYNPRLSGGGCVIDLGIHLVDLALWLLDFPDVESVSSSLFAGGKRLQTQGAGGAEEPGEDYAVADINLAGGAALRLACSWRLQAGRDAVIEATFYGTQGGVSLRNVDGSFYDFTVELYRGTSRQVLSVPPDEWGGRAAADWAQRLGAGERFDPEAWRFVDVAAALDKIYGR